ncbi:MAG: hypothetical protein COC05_00020 [Gammaproteobacteria bacterium]|nr:MAG: hypothetical protein COC05_00020 [Gammaproteobacteria bacterium]
MKLLFFIISITFISTLLFSSSTLAGQRLIMQPINDAPSIVVAAHHDQNNHNPCASNSNNPCTTALQQMDPIKIRRPSWFNGLYNNDSRQDLANYGEMLFNDSSLGSNGVKCNDCHAESNFFGKSFGEPYPHLVPMAKLHAGLDKVYADEFIQFCINVPLAGESLPWKSKKLAALNAYVLNVAQPAYIKKATGSSTVIDNPCAKNPCAEKTNNTSAVNACNPCAGKALGSALKAEASNILTPSSAR